MDIVMAGGHDVCRLLADADYDSKANWRKYTDAGIRVCINIRSPQLNEKYRPKGKFEERSVEEGERLWDEMEDRVYFFGSQTHPHGHTEGQGQMELCSGDPEQGPGP